MFEDLLKEYKYDMQVRNYSKKTIKTCYNSTLKFITYCKTEFDVEEIAELIPLHLKRYISCLQKLGRSEIYINSILKYLRGYFRYCVTEGYITDKQNITKKVRWLREKKPLITTFTDSEMQKMIKVWDYKNFYHARNKAIIAMLFETGIRNNELCTLKIMDVRDTVIKVLGKGNKERYVPISSALKKILLRYERIRNEYIKDKPVIDDYYFLSYRSRQLTIEAVERVVKQTGETARVRKEIRCSPHTCRHYYCQFLLSQGVEKNGYDIVKYICEHGISPKKIYFHTDNVVGRDNMYYTLMSSRSRGFIESDTEIYRHGYVENRV